MVVLLGMRLFVVSSDESAVTSLMATVADQNKTIQETSKVGIIFPLVSNRFSGYDIPAIKR